MIALANVILGLAMASTAISALINVQDAIVTTQRKRNLIALTLKVCAIGITALTIYLVN